MIYLLGISPVVGVTIGKISGSGYQINPANNSLPIVWDSNDLGKYHYYHYYYYYYLHYYH